MQPLLEKYASNYRIKYQYATALEESDQPKAAADEFLKMLEIDQEIPGRKSMGHADIRADRARAWL